MAKGQWAETGVGAVVILAAAGFLAYSLTVGGSVRPHGYEVRARFGQVGSRRIETSGPIAPAGAADLGPAASTSRRKRRVELAPASWSGRRAGDPRRCARV